MQPARLGILISGTGSTYANLARAIAAGTLPATIATVVSSREDAGGLRIARELGHRHAVAVGADAITAELHAAGAEWVAMCGFLKFWDPPTPWRDRVANIHPSLLPAFGGKGMYGIHVHRAVLAAGTRVTGCTVHLVAGAYDAGPIVAQRAVAVHRDDTPDALQARVQDAERALYPRALAALIAGRLATVAGRRWLDGVE